MPAENNYSFEHESDAVEFLTMDELQEFANTVQEHCSLSDDDMFELLFVAEDDEHYFHLLFQRACTSSLAEFNRESRAIPLFTETGDEISRLPWHRPTLKQRFGGAVIGFAAGLRFVR